MADMRRAFLADIVENIDDDTPRLVFADWLEENGDAARAEFMRLQCRLAAEESWPQPWSEWPRGEIYSPREVELIAGHGAEWQKEAPKWAWKRFCYHRGFISRVRATGPQWMKSVAGLYRRIPVEGLSFYTSNDVQLEEVAEVPEWKYLRLLNFYTHGKSYSAVARFFASAELRSLVTLDYRYHGTGPG